MGEQEPVAEPFPPIADIDLDLIDLADRTRALYHSTDIDRLNAMIVAATDATEKTLATTVLTLKLRETGDMTSAERLLRSCIEQERSDERLRSFASMHLFALLTFMGRIDDADDVLLELEAKPAATDTAVMITQRAVVASKREQHGAAITLWRRAIDQAQAEGHLTLEMLARNGYAVDLLAMNVLDEAEYQCRQVLLAHPWSRRLSGHASLCLSLVLARKGTIAESLRRLDQPTGYENSRPLSDCRLALTRAEALLSCRLLDEAEHAAARAIELSNEPLGASKQGEALMLRARVAIAARQLEPALRDIAAALEFFEKEDRPHSAERAERLLHALDPARPPDFPLESILSDTSVIEALYLTINRAATSAETIPYFRAIAQAAAADNIRERVLGLSAAVQVEILLGNTDRANELIDELLDAGDTLSSGIGSTEMLSNIFLDLSGLEFIALTLGQHGDPQLSFQLMGAAVARIHHTEVAKPHGAEFLAQLESLRVAHGNQRASQVTDAHSEAKTLAPDLPNPEFVALERRIRFLSRQVESAEHREHGRWLDDQPPTAPTVSFLLASGDIWRLFTNGTTARLDCVGRQAEIERELRRFRFTFDLAVNGFRPTLGVDAVRTSGLALEQLLLGGLGIDDSDLTFRLYRCLTDVPWRLLNPGSHCRSWSNPGVPHISEPQAMPELVNVAIVIGPDLGQPALNEAAAIAAIYPHVTILSGEQATVQRTLQAFEDADLVHLVGHGMPHADDPLLASVRLHDGPLTAYDLDNIEKAPAVVVLAACGLGSSGTPGRSAAYGLPGVLLRRGTLSVIGSPMVIDNALMSLIMADFHQSLASGATPVDALANLSDGDDKQALTAQSVISMQARPLLARRPDTPA